MCPNEKQEAPQLLLHSCVHSAEFPKPRWDTGTEVQYSTCVDRLPAHGERSPGLNDIHGDGAVVVRPGPPGELSRGVCNFIYSHGLRGAWRTWERARPSEVEHCFQMSKQVTTRLNGQHFIQLLIHPPPSSTLDNSFLNTHDVPISF